MAAAAPHLIPKSTPETHIQGLIESELDGRGILFFRIPDYAYATFKRMADAGDFKAAEVLKYWKNIPDVILLIPVQGENFCRAKPIEIKRGDGGRKSQGQKHIIGAINGEFTAGYEETMAAVERFEEDCRAANKKHR